MQDRFTYLNKVITNGNSRITTSKAGIHHERADKRKTTNTRNRTRRIRRTHKQTNGTHDRLLPTLPQSGHQHEKWTPEQPADR